MEFEPSSASSIKSRAFLFSDPPAFRAIDPAFLAPNCRLLHDAAGADAGAATAAAWPPIPLDAFLLDGACSPAPSQPCLLRAPRRAGPRAPGRGAPAARGASAR